MLTPIDDLKAFITENTRVLRPPHVPSIELYLADEALELWSKTEDQLDEIGLPPPFWAFAWAGGQAVARHILHNPDLVAGKHVIDFAAGGGIIAIAAMKAGAATVLASEIDPFAIAAMEVNAPLNNVTFDITDHDLLNAPPPKCDVLICGDVYYEREMAEKITAWLEDAANLGISVLIGDPGRSYLPREKLRALAVYEVPVLRALEDADVKKTTVWCLATAPEAE